MTITIRPPQPAQDYPGVAALLSALWQQTITAQSMHEWDHDSTVTGHLRRRMVAVDATQQVVGYSIVWHEPAGDDGRYGLYVAVAPTWRRQGIGRRLYAEGLAFATGRGATLLDSETRDNDPIGLAFARRRGFTIRRHTFQATIDLRTFDAVSCAGVIERVTAGGIRLFSLADAGDTDAARRKLYAVNKRCFHDDPGAAGSFPDFDAFNQRFDTAPWFLPAGQFLAADGDDYVGLTAVGYFADDNSMYNLMTGVDRAYRGRGIAQALKLKAIQFAQAYGADFIRTNNDSENAPMLAINRKLGYKPETGDYQLVKSL